MPKISLTERARAADAENRCNEAFVWALRTVRARLGKTYTATAEATGITRATLHNLTDPPAINKARFGIRRDVAHEIGMTR